MRVLSTLVLFKSITFYWRYLSFEEGGRIMIFVFLFLFSASLSSGNTFWWGSADTNFYKLKGLTCKSSSRIQDLRHYEGVHYTIYPDPLHRPSHATVGHLLIRRDTFIQYFKVFATFNDRLTRISHQDLMTYLNKDSANALRDARRLYYGVFDSLPSEAVLGQIIRTNRLFE